MKRQSFFRMLSAAVVNGTLSMHFHFEISNKKKKEKKEKEKNIQIPN